MLYEFKYNKNCKKEIYHSSMLNLSLILFYIFFTIPVHLLFLDKDNQTNNIISWILYENIQVMRI